MYIFSTKSSNEIAPKIYLLIFERITMIKKLLKKQKGKKFFGDVPVSQCKCIVQNRVPLVGW